MTDAVLAESKYIAARETLSANLLLQERLEETLKQLEEGIKANANQQAKIQAAALQMNRTGWYSGLKAVGFPAVGRVGPKAIGPSRFWMTAGRVPEPNEDTKKLYEAFSYLPHTFALRKWSKEEDTELEKIVLLAVQENAHSNFLTEFTQGRQQLTEEGLASRMQEIAALTLEDSGSEEVVLGFVEQWESIATQLGGVRTAADCRARWVNNLRPSAKMQEGADVDAWDKEEEARLVELAEAKGGRDWEETARELGNSWSALQCLTRFRQLTSLASSKPWTQEEILQLQISYARHANKAAFWKAVAADLPGRTHNQCMHFWRNQMDRTIKKGKWSPEEDEALKAAVEGFGRKWARVAEAVPTRNQVQVRERWVNVLDPDLKRRKPWTPEEDAILVEALKECKNPDGSIRWAEIARRFPGRTDDVVANHSITLRNFTLRKGAFKEKPAKKQKRQRAEKAVPKKKGQKQKKPEDGDESEAVTASESGHSVEDQSGTADAETQALSIKQKPNCANRNRANKAEGPDAAAQPQVADTQKQPVKQKLEPASKKRTRRAKAVNDPAEPDEAEPSTPADKHKPAPTTRTRAKSAKDANDSVESNKAEPSAPGAKQRPARAKRRIRNPAKEADISAQLHEAELATQHLPVKQKPALAKKQRAKAAKQAKDIIEPKEAEPSAPAAKQKQKPALPARTRASLAKKANNTAGHDEAAKTETQALSVKQKPTDISKSEAKAGAEADPTAELNEAKTVAPPVAQKPACSYQKKAIDKGEGKKSNKHTAGTPASCGGLATADAPTPSIEQKPVAPKRGKPARKASSIDAQRSNAGRHSDGGGANTAKGSDAEDGLAEARHKPKGGSSAEAETQQTLHLTPGKAAAVRGVLSPRRATLRSAVLTGLSEVADHLLADGGGTERAGPTSEALDATKVQADAHQDDNTSAPSVLEESQKAHSIDAACQDGVSLAQEGALLANTEGKRKRGEREEEDEHKEQKLLTEVAQGKRKAPHVLKSERPPTREVLGRAAKRKASAE